MVATCSADIVGAIEGVAWAVDQERRGTMSVGYRQDQTAVAQMIRDLLQDPLLSPENRLELRRQIAKAVMDEPADAKPARAPLPRRNRQRSPKR